MVLDSASNGRATARRWCRLSLVAMSLMACGGRSGGKASPRDAAQDATPESDGAEGASSEAGASRYTLTLSFAGKGSGTVTIQPGDVVCTAPTACTVTFEPGSLATLTAKPSSTGVAVTSVLSGWGGACAILGPSRFCSLRVGADIATTAQFDLLPANLAFVTSESFPGNLGSPMAYQDKCNQLATAAGINNASNDAYVAWMGATDYAPAALLGASRGWVRADLKPWIDSMSTALFTGAVLYPLAYDENGKRVIGHTLSGMDGIGAVAWGSNCNDWTDATADTTRGHTHAGGLGWPSNNAGVSSCGIASRVICVMKGGQSPVTIAPVAGKKIYLTRSVWLPGGGLTAADAKCLADAPASVKAAKAILVSSQRELTDVIDATATYVRPDGVKAGTGAEILQAMIGESAPATIEGAVIQDGAGKYVGNLVPQLVWTGLRYYGDFVGAGATCRDWTSSSPADTGTAGCVGHGWGSAGKCGGYACDGEETDVFALQCAEQ